MTYLEVLEVINLHDAILAQSGGLSGVRDMGGLESSLAQPQMTMFGEELYPTIAEKSRHTRFFTNCKSSIP